MHDICTKYKLQQSILTSLRFITQFSTTDVGVEAYDIIHVVFFPFLNILYQYITSVQIKLCYISIDNKDTWRNPNIQKNIKK